MKTAKKIEYAPPFKIEKVHAGKTHDKGWCVVDANDTLCRDADDHWLWANKASAQVFVRELKQSTN